MSDTDTNIYIQLARAQGRFPAIPKNGKNPHFKSEYALLDDIIQYTTPILSDLSLSITHVSNNMNLVTTLHFNDEKISSSMPFGDFMKGGRNALHELGSVMSYIKRYNLSALLNLALGDDIDGGNAGDHNGVVFKVDNDADKEKCITESGYQVGQILESFNASCLAELPSVSQLTETFREWYADAQQQDKLTDK